MIISSQDSLSHDEIVDLIFFDPHMKYSILGQLDATKVILIDDIILAQSLVPNLQVPYLTKLMHMM